MYLSHEEIGAIAGILATVGFIPYIVTILRGENTPSKASWIVWTVISIALAFGYKSSGANATMWVPISYAVGPSLVLIAVFYKDRSIRPVETWPKVDRVSFQIGLALFVPWIMFKRLEGLEALPSWAWILPLITLTGGIIIDGMGAIPTIKKSWQDPASEDFWGWTFWCAGNTINLWAVERWEYNLAAYPVYMAMPSGLIFPALLIHRLRSRRK